MAQNKQNNSLPIGLGVAAAAAAAAGGAYWLYGAKHSAQHRKMAKSWMLKARAEVMDAIEKLEDIDKERYMQIVDTVVKGYAAAGATSSEVKHMMRDFASSWKHIQGKTRKKVAKGLKRAARRPKKKDSKPSRSK